MDDTKAASPLAAELVRWLTAFEAGARAASAAAPGDPARPFADEMLGVVVEWLGRLEVEAPPKAPVPSSPAPRATAGWAEVIRQAGAERELPDAPWGEMSFADGWEPFHLALLGLAPETAEKLARGAAALATAQGAELEADGAECVPAEEDRLLIPGLRGAVTKKGLRVARACPLPAEFAAAVPDDLLAVLHTAAAVAALAVRAPGACSPSPDPLRTELARLVGPVALSFRAAIVDSVRRAAQAKTPRDLWLAWVRLDEAVHAAVVLPLPHPQSWWGLVSYRLRQSLSRAADEARRALGRIDLQVLRGEYRMIRRQSDERTDVRTTTFGHPGHVAVCLRVYTAIGDERFPGRVIYRP